VQKEWAVIARQSSDVYDPATYNPGTADLPVVEGWRSTPLSGSFALHDDGTHLQVLVQPTGIEATPTAEFTQKKDVPLHLQLVHLPSGWVSGVSEGFIVRSKVREGTPQYR